MNIWQRFRTAASVLLHAKGAFEQAFLRGLPLTRDGVADPYRQHAWVYACVTVIMRKIAGVPFIIASREKDNEGNQVELTPSESKVARLFKTVNPTMGPSELWQATVLYLYLQGEAFWLLELDENRDVVEIWPTNPKSATPILDENKENLIGWKITDHQGRTRPFGRDEVVFFRFLDPNDPLRGLAPIEPAELAISQDFQAAKHNEALLQNDAIPGGIVTIPEVMSEVELRREMRRWEQAHEGSAKSGKTGWLSGGMKFEAVGISQKDMDFILGRRFNREEILAVFGVPPAEVGIHEFSNYANAREQRNIFWNNTLLPLIMLIEETLESKFFLRHFPEAVGIFDLTNVEDLQENLEIKSEVATRLFGMGVSFADINARLQMGFETENVPHHQVGYLPLALVTVGGEEEPPPAPGSAPLVPASRLPARRKQREFARDIRDIYASQTRRAIPRMRDAVSDFFESEKAGVLSNIEEHYAALLREHGKSVKLAMTKWRSQERDENEGVFRGFLVFHCKTFESDVADLIFSVDASTGNLQAVAAPLTAQTLEESGQALATTLGLSFDASAPEVVAALTERANFLANVSSETFNQIRGKLLISIEKGESVREASDRIRDMYDRFSARRSQIIAQTEMGFAYNTAAVETYGQSGIEEHEWLSAGDGDVRASHQIDGEKVKVGERFSNGLLYPNEGGGPPEEVVNCRCTTIPVVEAEARISVFPRKSPRARPIRRADGQRTHLCPL